MGSVIEKIQAGAQIIDVRTPAEFAGGAYPNAKNIPVQEIAGRLGEIDRDKPVVLYCASGGRSGAATQFLKQQGYADVVNGGALWDMPRV
jgi:phage shock protein E